MWKLIILAIVFYDIEAEPGHQTISKTEHFLAMANS